MATRFIQNYINQLLNEAEEKPEKKPDDVIGTHKGQPVYRDPKYYPDPPKLHDEEGNYNPSFDDLPTVDPDKDAEMYPPSSQRKDFDQEAADKRREERQSDLEDPEKTKEMVDRLTDPEVRAEPRQYSDDAVARVLGRTGRNNPHGVRGRILARAAQEAESPATPDEPPARDAVDTPPAPSRPPAQPENRDKYDKILYGQGENPSDERRKMVDKMREQDKNRQNRYDHAPPAVKGALDSLRGGNLDGAIGRIESGRLQSKVGDIKSGVDSGRVRPRAETQVNTPGGHRLKGMERYIKDNPEYNQTTPIRSAVTGTRLRGLEKWRDNPRNPNQGQRVISPEGQAKVDSLEQGKQRDLDRYAEYGKYSKQLTDIAQNAYKRTRADYDRHYGSNNK